MILADADRDQLIAPRAADGILDPGGELNLGRSGHRQRCEVEIAAGGDLGAGLQRGHLAVAGVEQSGPPQEGADPRDHGEVQRIVGGIAGMNGGGDELPAGLGGGGHELELGQVGAMVLAVAQLHEAAVDDGVEAVAGGAVEADPLDGQGVDLAGAVPEVGLDGVPGFGVAESGEEQGEAVVGEIDVADGLSGEGFEGVMEIASPVADVGLAVVGVGEDVGDPDGDEPAEGESLMVGVGREVLVEELGEAELDEEAEEQGDVIDAFVGQLQGGVHGGAPTRAGEKRRCTAETEVSGSQYIKYL